MGKSWDSASDFLPGTFHKLTIWAETLWAAQGAHVHTLYAELECESEHTDHQGVYCSWPALFGEGNGDAFQHSCLKNPMNTGACQPTVHRVAKSQRCMSDFIFFHFLLIFIYFTGSIFNFIIYIFY